MTVPCHGLDFSAKKKKKKKNCCQEAALIATVLSSKLLSAPLFLFGSFHVDPPTANIHLDIPLTASKIL